MRTTTAILRSAPVPPATVRPTLSAATERHADCGDTTSCADQWSACYAAANRDQARMERGLMSGTVIGALAVFAAVSVRAQARRGAHSSRCAAYQWGAALSASPSAHNSAHQRWYALPARLR